MDRGIEWVFLGSKNPDDESVESVEESVDRPMGYMLQVFMVLTIIFVMANVIFNSKAKEDVENARKEAENARKEADKEKGINRGLMAWINTLEKTPVGKALIKVRKQKLLLALSEVASKERNRMGLMLFIRKNGTESIITNIFSEGREINPAFKEGCNYAYERFSKTNWIDSVRMEWLKKVNEKLTEEDFVLPVGQQPESRKMVVSDEIYKWFMDEVDKEIIVTKLDCRKMQNLAAEQVYAYFAENTDEIDSEELRSAIQNFEKLRDSIHNFEKTTPENKQRKKVLLEKFQKIIKQLRAYSKEVLERRGVNLLEEVR